MINQHRQAPRVLVLLAFAFTLGACLDDEEISSPMAPEFAVVGGNGGQANALEVYTQNLFLGGDTGPLFSIDLSDLGQVIPATQAFWAEVQASNISERAAEVVNELEARGPAVVALQEAVGYATGVLIPSASGFDFIAQALGPDLLQAVMGEIATRGLPYSIAVMQETTGIALPMDAPGATGIPALAVQDRVVMLRRNDVVAMETAKGLYAARIPLGPNEFVRGWVRMTVEHDGEPFHFVATHLETQGSGASDPIRQVHNGQAFELENAILAGLDGTTVLMGDLNSDAAADPSATSWTPTYGSLTDAGFLDVWDAAPHSRRDNGVTCCQENGATPRTPDERIDFVLVRTAEAREDSGNHRGWFRADVVGNEDADRTPSGHWPSDHAGIAASIRLPAPMR